MRMRVTGRHEHVETVVAKVYTNLRFRGCRLTEGGRQEGTHDPWPMLSDINTDYRAQPHNDTEFPAIRKLILPPTGMQ